MALQNLGVTLRVNRPSRHYSGCGANLFKNPSFINVGGYNYNDSNIQQVGISTFMGSDINVSPSQYSPVSVEELKNGSRFDASTGDYAANYSSGKPGFVLYVMYHSDVTTIYDKGRFNGNLVTYEPNIKLTYPSNYHLGQLGLKVIEHNDIDDDVERNNVLPNIENIINNSRNTLNAYKRFVIVFSNWDNYSNSDIQSYCPLYVEVTFRKIGTGYEYKYMVPSKNTYESELGPAGGFQHSIVSDLSIKYTNIRSFNFKLQPYILNTSNLTSIQDDNFYLFCDNKTFRSDDLMWWMNYDQEEISENLNKTVNYEISTTALYDLLPNNDNSYYPRLLLEAPNRYTDQSGTAYDFLGWFIKSISVTHPQPYELDALLYISSSSTCDFGINNSFFNKLITMRNIADPPFADIFVPLEFDINSPLFDGTDYIKVNGMEYGTIELAAIYSKSTGSESNKKIRIIKAY